MKVRYASGKTTAKGEREREKEGKTNCRLQKKSICPHLAIKQLSKYINSRQATNHHQQSSESKKEKSEIDY